MISKYSRSGGELYEDKLFLMFKDQLQKLMMRVESMTQMTKFMLDLTWVENLQEHTIVMN